MAKCLGRLPRAFSPAVPHLSALLRRGLAPPPVSVDYTVGLPTDLGELMNNQIGDCTIAAALHAQQVWSANANPPMVQVTDAQALAGYEAACGYNPADPKTDHGGIEQHVLRYWLNTGLAGNKLFGFIEVDTRNIDDVKRAIAACGVCFIGFEVPAFLMAGDVPALWDLNTAGDNSIVGGHAVVLAGYDAYGAKVISWGKVYSMTWGFFSKFVDESYALVDFDWLETTGKSPAGLTMEQIEAQMEALKV